MLANIYLLDFDECINTYISKIGGIYRRYSDDMIVVCPKSEKNNLLTLIEKRILQENLEIQTSKTQVFHFKKNHDKLICGQEFTNGINWNKNFIYLGFEFDGHSVLLKSASISGYYRKMKRTIARAKNQSKKFYNKNRGIIFKKRILKKFSYKGASRSRKWIWDNKVKGFKQSDHYDWGNFLSYAYKAANIMVNNKILNQTKRHWNILIKLLK